MPKSLLTVLLLLLHLAAACPARAAEGAAAAGIFWQQRSQPAEFQDFSSICTDGEVLVATGHLKYVLGHAALSFSKDGREWIPVREVAGTMLLDVAWGGGHFVAVGWRGEIYTSTNGRKWTQAASPVSVQLNSVAWTGTRFVAVGSEGTILTSTDGTAWQSVTSGTTASLHRVCPLGDMTVVLGHGVLLKSSDGLAWTPVDTGLALNFNYAARVPAGIALWSGISMVLWDGGTQFQTNAGTITTFPYLYGDVTSVQRSGDHWLLLTSNGQMAASADGISWARLEAPALQAGEWNAVPYADGWIVAGTRGVVLRVRPGISWSEPKKNASNFAEVMTAVVRTGDDFAAFGSGGTTYRSTDGSQWNSISGGNIPDIPRAAAFRNGRTVVVGKGEYIRCDGPPESSYFRVGPGVELFGVAASPDWFVAVGKDGKIYRSVEGEFWTVVASGTTELLTAVTWDGTRFQAVGRNGIHLRSTDGQTWQKQNIPGGRYLRAISATRSGLVAVGQDGAIFTSPDGVAWTDRSLATPQDFQTVVDDGHAILAMGTQMATARSLDGSAWELQATTGPASQDIAAAVSHQGTVVALTSAPVDFESLVSASPFSWGNVFFSIFPYQVEVLSSPMPNLRTITQRADSLIAAGYYGSIWRSTDGETWDQRSRFTDWSFQDSLTVGDLTVLVGSGGTASSSDGQNWQVGSYAVAPKAPARLGNLNALAHGGGRWVACGYRGNLIVSDDGKQWRKPANATAAGNDTIDLLCAAWGAGRFVVTGTNGKLISSADGETWVAHTPPPNNGIGTILWTSGEFRILTNTSTVVLVSPDGMNWSSRTVPAPPSPFHRSLVANGRIFSLSNSERIESSADGNSWIRHLNYGAGNASLAVYQRAPLDLAWTGSKYVAVGENGFIASSADGFQWTYRNGGVICDLNSVTHAGDRFLVTANDGGILSSPDGETWTRHMSGNPGTQPAPEEALQEIAWNGGTAVAVGSGRILYSTDLWTWSDAVIPAGLKPKAVTWAGDRFIAVGQSLWGTSPDGITWTFGTAPFWDATSIAWSGTHAVAAGYYSADGMTWTHVEGDWSGSGELLWDGQQFVGSGGTFLEISADGITGARLLDSQRDLSRVIVTPQGLLGAVFLPEARGMDLYRSGDGVTWTATGSRLPYQVRALAASSRQLMAVGEGGQIYTSSLVDSLPFHTQLMAEGYSSSSDLRLEGDANGDGIANGMAYYLGLPLSGDLSAADRATLPALQASPGGGLELVFQLPPGTAPDFLELRIEHSGDLGDWLTLARRAANGSWSDPSVEEENGRVKVPVAPGEDPGFWRLNALERD